MYKWLFHPRLLDPPEYLSSSNVLEPKKQMKKTAQDYRPYPWLYSKSARPCIQLFLVLRLTVRKADVALQDRSWGHDADQEDDVRDSS